mmetsp:Transcript_7409/g.8576  ORF Transcript_7409/g.8576 Transcript_7409/m.8576 type:complete len:136 (+) Transcript_7409:208-615(+)
MKQTTRVDAAIQALDPPALAYFTSNAATRGTGEQPLPRIQEAVIPQPQIVSIARIRSPIESSPGARHARCQGGGVCGGKCGREVCRAFAGYAARGGGERGPIRFTGTAAAGVKLFARLLAPVDFGNFVQIVAPLS